MENKHIICELLLATLQQTRAGSDIEDLVYDEKGTVTGIFSSGGKRVILVEGDSGIAMIKDVIRGLCL